MGKFTVLWPQASTCMTHFDLWAVLAYYTEGGKHMSDIINIQVGFTILLIATVNYYYIVESTSQEFPLIDPFYD